MHKYTETGVKALGDGVRESERPMNAMQVFDNEQFGEIRTVERDGEPWFVASDVCRALEIANSRDAIKRLEEDERGRFNLRRQGEVNIINEPGLYSLILGSRKPEARAFKRWITHEVIPAIRRTGVYAARWRRMEGDPAALAQVMAKLERLERRVCRMESTPRPARRALPARRGTEAATEAALDWLAKLDEILTEQPERAAALGTEGVDDSGVILGFMDDAYLYLMPRRAWAAVLNRCLADGSACCPTQRALYKGLRLLGAIATDETRGTATKAKWIDGHTVRALWLIRDEVRRLLEQRGKDEST